MKTPRWSFATISISSWYWDSFTKSAYSWKYLIQGSAKLFTTFKLLRQSFILTHFSSASHSSTSFWSQAPFTLSLLNISQLFEPTKECSLWFATICYPGSKLPWLENMHSRLAIAQHLAISIRSSNNVKITNSSDRYHKWFMIFFYIASIILLWCIVTRNTFYAQADKPTNPWQSMVEWWQESSLRSTEHVLTWGACTEHEYSERIMASWIFWLWVMNWFWYKHVFSIYRQDAQKRALWMGPVFLIRTCNWISGPLCTRFTALPRYITTSFNSYL